MAERSSPINYTLKEFFEPTGKQSDLLNRQLDALATLALSPAALEARLHGPPSVDRSTVNFGAESRLVSWRREHESHCLFIGDASLTGDRYFMTSTVNPSQLHLEAIASLEDSQYMYFMQARAERRQNPQCNEKDFAFAFLPLVQAHHRSQRSGADSDIRKKMIIGMKQTQIADQIANIGSYTYQTAVQFLESPFRPSVIPEYRLASSLLGMMLAQASRPDHNMWMTEFAGPQSPTPNGVIFEDGAKFVAIHEAPIVNPCVALTVMSNEGNLGPHGTQYCIGPDYSASELQFLRSPLNRETALTNLAAFRYEAEIVRGDEREVRAQLQNTLSRLIAQHAVRLTE